MICSEDYSIINSNIPKLWMLYVLTLKSPLSTEQQLGTGTDFPQYKITMLIVVLILIHLVDSKVCPHPYSADLLGILQNTNTELI